MIDRLKAHAAKRRGFTLIELLIVIAIIAILVVIAIVALNPVERIRDGNDERANSDVRSVTTALQACATKELAQDSNAALESLCNDWTALETNGYVNGTEPANLTWTDNGLTGANYIQCVFKAGGHGAPQPHLAGGAMNRTQIVEVTDAGSAIGIDTTCPIP